MERGRLPWLTRARLGAARFLATAFKGGIVAMLVVYFVVMVVLVIAALFANQRGGGSRGGWGGRGRGFSLDPLMWYWLWSPRWRLGRPYYGRRWERTLGKGDKVPFYKKVFAFVFGPDKPNPTQKQLDRAKLRLIRSRSGVLTTADLVEHTGTSVTEAEEEMGRLLGAYDGEAAVSPDGDVVYAFPGLMATVRNQPPAKPPNPAWMRLEHPQELTGNTAGANAAVIGMNAFTMLASATAPWFIFPRLGLGGPAAFVGLVLVPLVFSVLFFAAPLARMAGVAMENRRRGTRNVRRVLLGLVYDRALRGASVTEADAVEWVAKRLDSVSDANDVISTFHDIATEFDADVEVEADGDLRYRFERIRQQAASGESMRSALRLDRRLLGDVVFSTSDSSEEAGARDLELFDRALIEGDAPLTRRLPEVGSVSYEDDYELVAFDEELASR